MLSKIYGSNQGFQGPICRFVKWGEKKKPERGEKEEEERSGRKVGLELNGRELGTSHSSAELGAKIYGVELGASYSGAELPAMSSTEPRTSAPGTLAPRRVSSAPASMASI